MKKISKAEFEEVIRMAQFTQNGYHACVGVFEITNCVESMKRHGLALIIFLQENENNLGFHAKKILAEAERTIDRSTKLIEASQSRINSLTQGF